MELEPSSQNPFEDAFQVETTSDPDEVEISNVNLFDFGSEGLDKHIVQTIYEVLATWSAKKETKVFFPREARAFPIQNGFVIEVHQDAKTLSPFYQMATERLEEIGLETEMRGNIAEYSVGQFQKAVEWIRPDSDVDQLDTIPGPLLSFVGDTRNLPGDASDCYQTEVVVKIHGFDPQEE